MVGVVGVGATLGSRVAALRREAGLTLSDLSQQAGVSRSMLHEIEHDTSVPTVTVAARLAGALGVTIGVLVGELRPPRETNPQNFCPDCGYHWSVCMGVHSRHAEASRRRGQRP